MLPAFQISSAVEEVIREEWGRLLAALRTHCGDLQLAEDVLQDAVTTALQRWPEDGMPEKPAAWLMTTARRRLIDRQRRDRTFHGLLPAIQQHVESSVSNESVETLPEIPDKRLELIFTCCHPALDSKSQVALTLRTLCGLTTDEIARAFLDSPTTLAQRLVRAKRKIASAVIPYEVPERHLWQERLHAVLSCLYFIFNEGYSASKGKQLNRHDLANEAIRLSRITSELLPNEPEVMGLMALLLLHDARRAARLSHTDELIPLMNQNRALWDKGKIVEGTTLLKKALHMGAVGPYQLQAAISALHAEASDWESTDWAQIQALYRILYQQQPSPVVAINQAVALCCGGDPQAALALLEQASAHKKLEHYQPLHAAFAEVYSCLNQPKKARKHLELAISLSGNEAEKNYLQAKREALSDI